MKKKLELKKEIISELTRSQLSSLRGGNDLPDLTMPSLSQDLWCCDTRACVDITDADTCNVSSLSPKACDACLG